MRRSRTHRPLATRALPALLLAAIAAGFPAPAAEAPSRGPAPASADLRVGESVVPLRAFGTLPVVDVLVNGMGPYRFALDLSRDLTILSPETAKAAGLSASGSVTIRNPAGDGTLQAGLAEAEVAEVGHLMMIGLPVAVASIDRWSSNPDAPGGVLSAGSFTGFVFALDLPGGKLKIRKGELPPADDTAVFDFNWEDSPPLVPLTLAGETIPAHLDPGYAGSILLTEREAESLHLTGRPATEGQSANGAPAGTDLSATLEGTATIGRISLDKPSILWGPDVSSARIGDAITRKLVITLDPAHSRIRLLDSSAPVFRSRRGVTRYGFTMKDIAAELLEIDNVSPASAAHSAQLQHGDVVVQMNGANVATLDEAHRVAALKASPLKLKIRRGKEFFEVTLAFGDP